MFIRLSSICLAAFLLALPLMARAEEVITRFHSDISVEASGEMEVTETIAVVSEGVNIRHGIFRDFPLTFLDRAGRTAHVDFTLLGVKRDGSEEPYKTETIENGIRIYAGSADSDVSTGSHVYEFRYRTDRQIRFFEEHDEVYWNVTGNGWMFPIEAASARVELPARIPGGGITFYTGVPGSKEQNARISRLDDTSVEIVANGTLSPGEGLSIVISQPKGAIAEPDGTRLTGWFLRDNLGAIIGWAGFIGLFFYYFRSWSRVGRDPPSGVMVPRWDPPGRLSPALVSYVDNKGFSGEGFTALSASALQLAVKGYLTLEDLDASIVLKRTTKAVEGALPRGEDVLLAAVEQAGGSFAISASNGVAVQSAAKRFRSAIEKEHRGKYYLANSGYVIGGVLVSIAVLAASFYFAHVSEEIMGLGFIMVIVATVGGGILSAFGRGFSRSRSLVGKVFAVIGLGIFGFISLSIIGIVLLAAGLDVTSASGLPLITSAGGIVLLNILFFFLMGAPTPLGRGLMDGIEGFRTYMTLAEKDRMNMAGVPTMSPAHFEILLPYAVALGVEKPWSDAFQNWLSTAAATTAAAYQPVWYSGHAFDSGRIGRFPGSIATTIASTIPKPQSSSSSGFSSGGGFSGGGGGGGGGGGW